jgi:hypothetical protein
VVPSVEAASAGVLRFTEKRQPTTLARFVRLRVIDQEGAYWRCGVEIQAGGSERIRSSCSRSRLTSAFAR